jgi:hypothetical protein
LVTGVRRYREFAKGGTGRILKLVAAGEEQSAEAASSRSMGSGIEAPREEEMTDRKFAGHPDSPPSKSSDNQSGGNDTFSSADVNREAGDSGLPIYSAPNLLSINVFRRMGHAKTGRSRGSPTGVAQKLNAATCVGKFLLERVFGHKQMCCEGVK